ncbi:hypothetical protein BACCAP_03103 [Pseudoflavonifractor capillosus ATCC 29799]|uniref:Uncharacterized protein n=1 Tax=Pseudoflavonifractor capillosus ATCC 29799 TaxID=411467 RepID=A6NY06_9FIRM|nr:hypothetical protein BACCAP_03103 [Pseudoflavonifractor capillosus ATCC 29799]
MSSRPLSFVFDYSVKFRSRKYPRFRHICSAQKQRDKTTTPRPSNVTGGLLILNLYQLINLLLSTDFVR